jgi:hypothetical protein
LLRQSLVTGFVLILSAIGTALGADWARTPFMAAVTVQLLLAAALVTVAVTVKHERRALIIAGREVWLPMLERERRRLSEPRRREALAGALEDLVHEAEGWHRILPASRPVYDPLLVRQARAELLAIAAVLRGRTVDVRGVARCERLLRDGTSPLFGSRTEELLAELARIDTDLRSGGATDTTASGEGVANSPE